MAQSVISKYGLRWTPNEGDSAEDTALRIEMGCIERGIGSVVEHYEAMRQIIWPELDSHRWHKLIMSTIIQTKCTVLAGVGSSGKSHEGGCCFLMEYWVWPAETCVLVSSTHMDGLRGRIWSDMSSLWQRGKDRFPWLSGNLLDSRTHIMTDSLDESSYDDMMTKRARDYRKGIKGIACRNSSGQWVGLNRYMGWKQKRMRLIADEAAQMEQEFIKGVSNLNSNPNFKCIIIGNFDQPTDCLGRCAEPVDGWTNHMEPRKTVTWETFYPLKGICINLIGFDSPNFDYPKTRPDEPDRYDYLPGPKKIDEIRQGFGEQSIEFMSQCWGCMKVSVMAHRVLTREICETGQAFEDTDWHGGNRTRVAFLDSAWGGDRCVFSWCEFGMDVHGREVLRCNPPEIVPLGKTENQDIDYAIADWCKRRCEALGIPPENFGHDSTGRGSLGTALAAVWSHACNPIEFGGQPTERPVTEDYYWTDPITHIKRLKMCKEHYVKFVTELWFTFRYAVEASQIRNLSDEVAQEFYARNWKTSKDDKREVEPKSGTKERPGMKQRTGKSPDLADSHAGMLEMARRRGFKINRLSNASSIVKSHEWIQHAAHDSMKFHRRGELVDA